MITLIDEPKMETIRKGKESTTDFMNTPTCIHKTCVKSTSRSTYFSERYKNMTLEQREARRERQRLYNSEPKCKEALKISDKKFKEMRKHTLHPESIAMENPLYAPEVAWPTAGASRANGSTMNPRSSTPSHISIPNEEAMKLSKKKFEELQKHTLDLESISMENPLFSPELVWPIADASGAHGSTVKSSDRVVPDFFGPTPIYIPPSHEESDDEGCDELLPRRMTQRSHAPSGQRHALLTRRNTMFERRIGLNTRASHKEGDCMAEDRVDANTPLPQSAMTNNGKY
jgi:hypothetical protein